MVGNDNEMSGKKWHRQGVLLCLSLRLFFPLLHRALQDIKSCFPSRVFIVGPMVDALHAFSNKPFVRVLEE